MSERHKVEFDHMEGVLAGLGEVGVVRAGREARIARTILEDQQMRAYDKPGSFAYVGWDPKRTNEEKLPGPRDQLTIYAAFAQSAVASGVYLGAVEPNEGFGLTCWADEVNPHDPYCCGAILRTMELANLLLIGKHGWDVTNLALGWGRLRGGALVDGRKHYPSFLLDGPKVVETIYGDLPNRCGGLAKGKDPAFSLGFKPSAGSAEVMRFRQPWSILHDQNPHALAVSRTALNQLKPEQGIGAKDRKSFLVGLSLDFAQSSAEYRRDSHRARFVVQTVLTAFENLVDKIDHLFVSPRYGDGLGAVIVLESDSEDSILKLAWMTSIRDFCVTANEHLAQCYGLGLRVAMAITVDNEGAAARLCGVSRSASPIVEPLAEAVLTNARKCHPLSKDNLYKIKAEREAKWLFLKSDGTLEEKAVPKPTK